MIICWVCSSKKIHYSFWSFNISKYEIFLKHLLGITKVDEEKNQRIRGKNGNTELSKGNKTVLGKVATTCTEDWHK